MITDRLMRPGLTLYRDHLGSGPDILLLHAGGERRQVWRPVMTILADRYRCTAYDQRGHGESGGNRDGPVTLFGEDTVAMLADLRNPLLVGASLGGFAALLALADPAIERRVAGLVLVDVTPDPDPAATRRFLEPLGMADSPLVGDILGRAEALRGIAARLTLPMLAIRAGQRGGPGDPDAVRFASLVPHAQFATVRAAGHLIARDRPAELAALLASFQESREVAARRSS